MRALTFATAAFLLATAVSAQTPEALVRRQRLLDQLETALREERHTDALQYAQQAGEIRMTPSIRMYLAEEHNTLGHLPEALENARQCVSDVNTTPNVNNRDRILERCNHVSEAVQPRLGIVLLRLNGPRPPGLRVWLGQTEVPLDSLGREIPTPAGPTRIEATARGGATFSQDLVVVGRGRHEVDLLITGGSGGASSSPIEPATQGPGVAPWVVFGMGVASLGAAAVVFAVPYQDARGSFPAECRTSQGCRNSGQLQQAQDANDRLSLLGPVIWTAIGAGTAAVTSGLVWYLLERNRSRPRTSLSASIFPLREGALVGLDGRF